MNPQEFLIGLNQAEDRWVKQAGVAGGHLNPEAEALSDSVIESAHVIRADTRKPRSVWLGLAASLALVAAAGSAWLLLRNAKPLGEGVITPGSVTHMSSPVSSDEGLAPTEDFTWPQDYPYPNPDTLAWLEEKGISLQTYYKIITQDPFPSDPERSAPSAITPDPALEQALLELEIGGLRLGMTREQVYELYGEPTNPGGESELLADGTRRNNWSYYFGEGQSLLLDFVDPGDGYILDQILCSAQLERGLPLGIQIGQDFDQAEAAIRADPILGPVLKRSEEDLRFGDDKELGHLSGSLDVLLRDVNTGDPGLLRFHVGYTDRNENGPHFVGGLSLGPLYPAPPYTEPTPEEKEKSERFNTDQVTIWSQEDGAWLPTDWNGSEAKAIYTRFSIEELSPWDYDGSEPLILVDFHNGTAAAVFDRQGHGAIYRLQDRVAWLQGMAAGKPLQGVELWEYVQLPAGTLQVLEDPEAFSSDWSLRDNVGDSIQPLLDTVEEKGLLLFRSSDSNTILYREKGHYVMAYAYGDDRKITGYATFREDHSRDLIAGKEVPLVELDRPEKLPGMDLAAVKKLLGAPSFETEINGERCLGYLSFSGYVVVLHCQDGLVTTVELYDQSPTPRILGGG